MTTTIANVINEPEMILKPETNAQVTTFSVGDLIMMFVGVPHH